jgi:hypothetical protein
VLDDPDTKEKFVLIKDLPARASATSALLTSIDGKTTLKVKEGQVLPGRMNRVYSYVVELRGAQVIVQQLDTRDDHDSALEKNEEAHSMRCGGVSGLLPIIVRNSFAITVFWEILIDFL